jgi:hypothetical protein
MIRIGARASYQGNVGTITTVHRASDPKNGRYLVWTLTYDEPLVTRLICGCHKDWHRYLGVHSVASDFTLLGAS